MIHIKVLLFGSYDPFTLSLISRLNKEGHKVFVVTGSKRKIKLKPRDVFQEYSFPYQSESISYIIGNINADIAIFTGALDTLFDLENRPSDISDYLAGLTNIMLYLKNSSINQFIYVSSLSIFSGNSERVIDETTKPVPIKDMQRAILIGEEICKNYYSERDFGLNILRFSEIYGTYEDDYLKNNICAKICEKVLENQNIEVLDGRKHNILYLDDAVDALYKTIDENCKDYNLYHIGSKELEYHSEKDIVMMLERNIKKEINISIIENTQENMDRKYSVKKIDKLNFNEKYHIEDKIKGLYNTVQKSIENQDLTKNKKPSFLGKIFKINGEVKNKIFPFIENLIFFILLHIFIYFTKDMGFHEVIDLYLLYVIVIGLIYGYEQAIFTVILSIIAKLYTMFFWNINYLSLSDYYIYMWILELFTIGVLVGYLKERYKIRYMDILDEKTYIESQLNALKEINKNDAEIKNIYEKRLVNYNDSFGRIYEIVSELDMIEPKGIIFKSIKVIGRVMNTRDISIYISSGSSGFSRLVAASSEKSKGLGKSLENSEHRVIFEKLENKEIYVNSKLNPKYPLMAGATYKNGYLQSIIMVWSLPFENNNLYQMNIFGIVCRLIERSMNTAYEYIDSISKSNNMRYDNVLDEQGFEKILETYRYGVEENIVEYSLLKIKRNIRMTNEDLFKVLRRNIRETDYIGPNQKEGICILLTNTNREEANYVIDRLNKNGISVEDGELNAK